MGISSEIQAKFGGALERVPFGTPKILVKVG